jgi:hypothetical protein
MQKSTGKDLLMASLSKFYAKKDNIEMIIPIINGKSNISLRLLDWFVTNYSKKTSTIVGQNLNVYLSYRSQLKAYSKQQFDPFRRRDRISFYYNDDNFIETTIGQLNFFKWVLQNNILEYIELHIKDIEQDMFSVPKKIMIDNGKKRNELSRSFVKNMNKCEESRTITF